MIKFKMHVSGLISNCLLAKCIPSLNYCGASAAEEAHSKPAAKEMREAKIYAQKRSNRAVRRRSNDRR
jgi:hypothetical protein